jgi:hypothetical protein
MPSEVSLSFEGGAKATPIAVASGGEYNNEVLYLHDEMNKGKSGVKELEIGKHRLGKLPPRKASEVMRILQEAYKRRIPPEHLNMDSIPGAADAYAEMFKEAETNKTIKLPPASTFGLIPSRDPKKREIWYIAGASGSGKSYIAKRLAEQYMKQFPERTVYLVSKLDEDSTLDSMKKKPVRLDASKLVETPVKDLEALRDSLIIFDDYDTFIGKEGKVIQQLIDDIAVMGRHQNITMLCLTHYLSNYKKTRLMLTEATHFVLYPQSTGSHALNYLLKTYLGLDPKEVKKLKITGSRWICIHKNFPIYCITENSAWIMNEDDEDEKK